MSVLSADEPARPVQKSKIQVLDRAVALLAAVGEAGPAGLPLRDLASKVGLHPSTAHSLLGSLQVHGLLTQDTATRNYRLGGRFIEIGRNYLDRLDLAGVAGPVMARLWNDVSETIHLSVLQFGRRVDLTVLVGPEVLSVNPGKADPNPFPSATLHRTAAGKVLLAGLGDSELDDYLERADLHDPAGTRTARDVRAELAKVRTERLAANREEEAVGVCGLASPVVDHSGRWIAALCIGYPVARSTVKRDRELAVAVRSGADEISALLGAASED